MLCASQRSNNCQLYCLWSDLKVAIHHTRETNTVIITSLTKSSELQRTFSIVTMQEEKHDNELCKTSNFLIIGYWLGNKNVYI